MSFAVGFIQCQQKRQLPHMNMPLFMPDLRAAGCETAALAVNAARPNAAEAFFRERSFDLIGIEHWAPHGLIRRLRAWAPSARLVVGGHGFLDVFAKTDVDFALQGAGREGLRRLVEALREHAPLDGVPNLLYKRRDGSRRVLDASEATVDLSLDRELRPYAPEIDWATAGFSGPTPPLDRRGSPPTLVADLGCPCRARTPRGDPASFALASSPYPLTDRARVRLAALAAQRLSGGCSFCTYGGYAAAPLEPTLALLLEQMEFLQRRYGFQRFCIGSEAPFRFLLPLMRRAAERGLAVRHWRLRCRVDGLIRGEGVLREALALARDQRCTLAVWQVGFESFSDRHLERYAKRQTVRQNLEAARLLDSLEREFAGGFSSPVGSHGFLGSTAWTTMDDLAAQREQVARLPRRWRRAILGGPVKLFDELLPYARDLERDRLLARRRDTRDGYRFRDPRVLTVERARRHLLGKLRRLPDSFFWRSALDAYWEHLPELLGELRGSDPEAAGWSPRRRAALDRRLAPILSAYRHYRAGALREARGRLGEAQRAYCAARRLQPENGLIEAALFRVAQARNQAARARGHARAAILRLEFERERSPEDPRPPALLAPCYAALGETERAAECLREGFALRRAIVADEETAP